jgi:hypothetical protein
LVNLKELVDGFERKAAAGSKELEEQRERGEWSGLCAASGSPIYTLREIAEAVVREAQKEMDDDANS